MTKNSYSYYNGETYALISNDKKRRVFLNDPKRWFVSKTQAGYLRVRTFNHFGVRLLKVEIYGEFDKWDFEKMDTVPVLEWRSVHNGYYQISKDGTKIYEPINETQAITRLKNAYATRGETR